MTKKDDEAYVPKDFSTPAADDVDKLMESLRSGKIVAEKEAIEDINNLVGMREELHKEMFKDLNKIEIKLNNFLKEMEDKISAEEIIKVEQKRIDIEQFRVQEKLNEWRDIAELKKELRDRMQELQEKESKTAAFEKILEE